MTTKTRITLKQAGVKPGLWRKIKNHAMGSIYRMNATSADLYTFTFDSTGRTMSNSDWEGGWSWFDHPGTWNGDLAVDMNDGKLYKLASEVL